MSKTVKIPNYGEPWWSCKINATEYKYASGTTQTVPDEVAELIAQVNDSIPKESGKNAPLMPSPSKADVGKTPIINENGEYELAIRVPTDEQVTSAVDDWLVDHPEATTTVQDNSVTDAKLVQSGGVLSEVSELKSATKYTDGATENMEAVLGISRSASVVKTISNAEIVFIPYINLSVGDIITCTLTAASNKGVYFYIYKSDGTRYTSRQIAAGNTSASVTLTDALESAYVSVYTAGTGVEVTVSITAINTGSNTIKNLENIALSSETVKTIGHRGNILDAPQNTAPAYIIARQNGIKVMENDLDVTDDNHFVMWHDGYLHALGDLVDITGKLMYTDGSNYYYYDSSAEKLYTYDPVNEYVESQVPLSGLTRCNGNNYAVRTGYSYGGSACTPLLFDVLRRVDFGAYKDSRFKGTQILTLAEWLVLCKKLGCEVYIDRKLEYTPELITTAATLVKNMGMAEKSSWIGMSTTEWATLRSIISDARVGILVNPTAQNVETYAEYNIGRGLFFDGDANSLSETAVHLGLSSGYEVECYYVGYQTSAQATVFATINQLLSWGVQGITLDKYTVEDATHDLIYSY